MPKDSPRESKYGLWYDAAATLQEMQWFAAVELGRAQVTTFRKSLNTRGLGHLEVYIAGEGPHKGTLIVAHPVKAPADYENAAPPRGKPGRPRKV